MICFNQVTFIFMIILVVSLTLLVLIVIKSYHPNYYQYSGLNMNKENMNKDNSNSYEINKKQINNDSNNAKPTEIRFKENKTVVEVPILNPTIISNVPFHTTDIIRQYDYNRAYDPLEQPVRRISRDQIHPYYFKRVIDLPTRGYPDNFSQIGILIKHEHSRRNDQNKILRLFGRREFPSSNRYEYYTAINSGLDQIKIPISIKRRNELYDDDIIYIKELNSEYKVSLHKYDSPRYYPDLL